MGNSLEQEKDIPSEAKQELTLDQAITNKLSDHQEQQLFSSILQQDDISKSFSQDQLRKYIQENNIQGNMLLLQ